MRRKRPMRESIALEGVRVAWLNISGVCGLNRNMLGHAEIIGAAGLSPVIRGRVDGDAAVCGLTSCAVRGFPLNQGNDVWWRHDG
jgi:hypothetical protein